MNTTAYQTMFREPISRVRSHYDQWGAPKNMTWEDYLKDYDPKIYNWQAITLLFGVHTEEEWKEKLHVDSLPEIYEIFNAYPESFIGIIEEILDTQFVWVGSVDNGLMDKSMELFQYQFNMQLDDDKPVNVREHPTVLSDKDIEYIRNKSRLDQMVAEYAVKRVERHWNILQEIKNVL